MNAKEAQKKARDVNTSHTNRALAAARGAIDQAIAKGQYHCFTYEPLSQDAVETLKSDGFHVREWNDRDGYGAEISWQ